MAEVFGAGGTEMLEIARGFEGAMFNHRGTENTEIRYTEFIHTVQSQDN
jgi:hypothetical protein